MTKQNNKYREFTNEKSKRLPITRNAANARERARMRILSKAFVKLKTTLPWVPPDTKLSKLDTLRLASKYIDYLRQILNEDCYNDQVNTSNLVWPFCSVNKFNSTLTTINQTCDYAMNCDASSMN